MEWMTELMQFMCQEWRFFSWRDAVEIIFFSAITYSILSWLSADEQKNLVRPFYTYFLLIITTYFLGLGGIFIALLFSLPIGAILFVVLHEKTLQKNYVTLKTLTPKITHADQWLEELIQASIRGINKNKSIICIIERNQSLSSFFSARCTFNAPITRELLDLLFASIKPEEQTVIFWATQSGKLIAFNPIWLSYEDEVWTSPDFKLLHKHKQDALFITKKSDALATIISPENRLFDLLYNGKSFDNVSAGYAFSLAKQIILSKPTMKGHFDAPFNKPHSFEQPNP